MHIASNNFLHIIPLSDRVALSGSDSLALSKMWRGDCVPKNGRYWELERQWGSPAEISNRSVVSGYVDRLARMFVQNPSRISFYKFLTVWAMASVGGGVYSLANPTPRRCAPPGRIPRVGTAYSVPRHNWHPATPTIALAIKTGIARGYYTNQSFGASVIAGFKSKQFAMFAAGMTAMVGGALAAGANTSSAGSVAGAVQTNPQAWAFPPIASSSPSTFLTTASGYVGSAGKIAGKIGALAGTVAGVKKVISGNKPGPTQTTIVPKNPTKKQSTGLIVVGAAIAAFFVLS